MNRVFISSSDFDLEGHLVIDPLAASDFGVTSRRVNKVRTLDGGVTVNDGGFAYGDKDFSIAWRTRAADFEARADAIVRNHPDVYVTTADGCFLATPSQYQAADGQSTLTLLIREKLN